MTAPELKPCPFCGGDDIRQEYGAGSKPPFNDPYVVCVDCGCSISGMAGAWNRRADLAAVHPAQVQPDPRDEVIKKLVGAVHNCVGMLDQLVAESGRLVEWDAEDPFRMGEWFEPEDLAQIESARAALAAAKAV